MLQPLRIASALTDATERLRPVSDSARLDAEILLSRALNVERSYLFGHPADTIDDAARSRFEDLLGRRGDGVPLSYITGEKEFWSLPLMVTPDTLVPRPETELLVQQALNRIALESSGRIVDLGTGSGAIALAIAKERPNCTIVGTDISGPAIAVARQNARQLEISNVEFRLGNWTSPVAGDAFDLIVCNPPYIRSNDPALDSLAHEPQSALVSGTDGLNDVRILADAASAILAPGGELLLEHGADQQTAVAQILLDSGWASIRCCNDLGGRPRVTAAARV